MRALGDSGCAWMGPWLLDAEPRQSGANDRRSHRVISTNSVSRVNQEYVLLRAERPFGFGTSATKCRESSDRSRPWAAAIKYQSATKECLTSRSGRCLPRRFCSGGLRRSFCAPVEGCAWIGGKCSRKLERLRRAASVGRRRSWASFSTEAVREVGLWRHFPRGPVLNWFQPDQNVDKYRSVLPAGDFSGEGGWSDRRRAVNQQI